jgi:prefoldin, archaeal alpha subunit/eukaryotic subunit 5
VAQLRYLQNIYSQQYEMIESEIATYSLALSAINKNIDMLEDPDKINNKEMLLNGEGGTYIVAKIKPVEQVITYVGAGYLVEKSLEDAKAFLNDNRKKQEENLRRLSEEEA